MSWLLVIQTDGKFSINIEGNNYKELHFSDIWIFVDFSKQRKREANRTKPRKLLN
jgi:hypothetical protein